MKTIFFDTETTGFNPGNICQLAYIIKDEHTIQGKNFYFTVDYVEHGAEAVHGLSIKKLEKLSNKKRFSSFAYEIKSDFEDANILVAHNYSFDERFLVSEFSNCQLDFKTNNYFCSMKYFTPICRLRGRRSGYKYPKLEELAYFFGVGNEDVLKQTKKIFDSKRISFHDARFDIVTTYLCCLKAQEQRLLDPKILIP